MINQTLLGGYSKELKARMQGKTCFNFKTVEEPLFKELEALTARGGRGMAEAGFIAQEPSL